MSWVDVDRLDSSEQAFTWAQIIPVHTTQYSRDAVVGKKIPSLLRDMIGGVVQLQYSVLSEIRAFLL